MLTPETISTRLADGYSELISVSAVISSQEERLSAAKLALAQAKRDILLAHPDPKTLGSNEAAREAAIVVRTMGEQSAVIACETLARSAHAEATLARLRVEAALAQLRVLELATAIGGRGTLKAPAN